jgi:MoxR-like ATPase
MPRFRQLAEQFADTAAPYIAKAAASPSATKIKEYVAALAAEARAIPDYIREDVAEAREDASVITADAKATTANVKAEVSDRIASARESLRL